MKNTISNFVVAISALFSVTIGAATFWLALVTTFYLTGPLSPASAAITSAGDVSPANPSSWTSSTQVYIGNTASGTLTVDGGSDLLSYYGYLGYGSSATGVVNIVGSGSTWVNTVLEVGKDGSGLLSITNGGSVTSVVGYLGYGPTSTGVVTVDGAGSTWTNSQSLYVGYGGAGTLNITNGGSVSVADTTYVSYAGNFYPPTPAGAGMINFGANGGILTTKSLFVSPAQMAGTGTINTHGLVSDIDLVFDSTHGLKQTFTIQQPGLNATVNLDMSDPNNLGSLGAGYYGAGSLTIRGFVYSSVGYLGFNAGSTGVATVNGSWINDGTLYVGVNGNGTLSIAGSVFVGGETWVGAFAGSTGAINFVTSGGALTTQSLFASPSQFTGTGTIGTRGLVSDIDLIFDSTHALKRTLMFQQSGSKVTVNLDMSTNPSTNGSLGAGWRGAGSLTIQDGIKVSSPYGYVGFGNGSTGVATVSGTGSTWTNSIYLWVGYFGTGTLNITNGGTVAGNGCKIGTFTGSMGTVTVDGVGSTWTNKDPQTIYVGYNGNGMLKITNGGSVSGGIGRIADLPGSTGVVTVDGAGSTWTGKDYVTVGHFGSGTLSITNLGQVVAGGGTIALEVNSTGAVTVDGAGSNWTNTGGITVGSYGSGTLSITRGSSVTSTSAYIGNSSGSTGTATVDGSGSTWNAGGLNVGNYGSGTLRISNGAHVDDARGGYGSGDYIGTNAGSTGTVMVDGIGSAWTNNSTLYIGSDGTGTLSITGGGFVNDTAGMGVGGDSTAAACIGSGSKGAGVVTVDGLGSTWMNNGSLYVGYSGPGTLNITNGGSVSVAGTTYVGRGTSNPVATGAFNFGANGGTLTTQSLFVSPVQIKGTGTINTRGLVSDIDLIFDTTHGLKQTIAIQQPGLNATVNFDMSDPNNLACLGVGYYGAGSLTIRDGIVVNSTVGYLGYYAGSTGVATVDGIGSTWTNNGTLGVGNSGEGTLTVINGGVVNTGAIAVGSSGSGTLSITGGGSVTCTGANIGNNLGSTGTVTVDGAGSKWTNSGQLFVGYFGKAILNITQGGTVTSSGGYVGDYSGSTGMVTVDGVGSTWTDSSGITVNYGTLSIANGGSVSSNGSISVGYRSSTAMITVDGAGSTLTSGSLRVGSTLLITNGGSVTDGSGYVAGLVQVDGTGSSLTSNSLSVGNGGDGTLSIINHGIVITASGSIGDNSGSSYPGAVIVNGAGSMWAGGSNLYVGNSGSGSLTISDGGAVTCTGSNIGNSSGSSGTVMVKGTGSTWTNNGSLLVGNSGSGTMIISDRGAVTCTGCNIGKNTGSSGTAMVDGTGATWTNSGSLLVGNSGKGTLTIRRGGAATNSDGSIGYLTSSTSVAVVDGVGSTWTNSGSLSVGGTGTGTLSITCGGMVMATNVSVNSKSLLTLDVGHGSSLVVGGGAGTTTNNGKIRIVAGAGVAADGAKYSPISTGSWDGTGTFQAMGGTWDTTDHSFMASSVTSGKSGSAVALNLASVQRTLINDNGTGWEVGASFLTATSTKNITFTATAINGGALSSLKNLLPADESVLGGWNFLSTNYPVSSTNPAYLSLKIGPGYPIDEIDLWHYNGFAWAKYAPTDLTYDGTYASFTVTSFSGYAVSAVPEPGTLVLLGIGAIALVGYACRRKQKM